MEPDDVRQLAHDKTGDAMTPSLLLDHVKPWTESEFLAIGETSERIELFDGSLHVTPGPTPTHQHISTKLAFALTAPAEAIGLFVHEAINLRVGIDRIPIPDLAITTMIDFDEPIVDASVARLVCEILSPSNSTTDKVLKMHYYAEAGIPWYLLVEPKTATLRLHRLDDGKYLEYATAAPGTLLKMTEPVAVTIDPTDLLPPG
ncbi:Uma2 family endonuclease [Actinoplanes sp. NEAU-A12]|uniref:Uma2 family endonuclease n=1 Tax=Actinoplanes sandaracinus TaxID=3045177 RepID=A0ABT6WIX7_9ACTN|nr:Uma2 family endonuclease [Actinoplanes sandaracinus]MDI6099663.1 Uma2 family endonuclease [Actinoplanes sandaracinus]